MRQEVRNGLPDIDQHTNLRDREYRSSQIRNTCDVDERVQHTRDQQNNAGNLCNVINSIREMGYPNDNRVHGQIVSKIAVGSNCPPAPRSNARELGVTVVEDPLDATRY